MEFIFLKNKEAILRSIEVTRSFITALEKKQMFYYFPFDESDLDVNDIQLSKDLVANGFEEKAKQFQQYWDDNKDRIFSKLNTYLENRNIKLEENYKCVMTLYGPYGYYEDPNTIYLNIKENNSEFWAETLLHELLHLVIRTNKEEYDDSGDTEAIVDDLFVNIFGTIFTNYHKQ